MTLNGVSNSALISGARPAMVLTATTSELRFLATGREIKKFIGSRVAASRGTTMHNRAERV